MKVRFGRTTRAASIFSLLVAGSGVAACGPSNGGPPPPSPAGAPQVLALSSYSAALGTPIDVVIGNLPRPTDGSASLRFQGTYRQSSGNTEKVDFVAPTQRIDGATVRWTGFGPFANPFQAVTAEAQTGVFEGTVTVRVVRTDGTIDENPDTSLHLVFEVLPSVLIEDFQPTSASCASPAKRAFGGLYYKARVRAMGFTPVSFTYRLEIPNVTPATDPSDPTQVTPQFVAGSDGQPTWTTLSLVHAASGAEDAADGKDAFFLPPLPPSADAYNTMLAVQGADAAGHVTSTTLVIQTQQPFSFYYDGRYQLAQIYPAVPVSSCMPGGPQGRIVSYTDANTQTMQRSFSLVLSESFMNSVSHSQGQVLSNTWATSDGKTYSHAVTDTSGWANSTSNGISNTQGSSATTGSSSTSGSSGSNAFTITGMGSTTTGDMGTINYSTNSTNAVANQNATGWKDINGGDVSAEPFDVGLGYKYTHEDTGGIQVTDTNTTGSMSGGSESASNSNTSGWAMSGTGVVGTSSSDTNSSSNTTSASTTNSTVDTNAVSGSTATTDSTSASVVETRGGGLSTSTSDGSSASMGSGSSTANGWSVSSSETIGMGFTGLVIADTYGVFYRQMARYVRESFFIQYDKCGDGQVIGEATLQDYVWAPDLAQAAECPPLPPTNFPPPQCYLPPCDP